MFDQTSCFRSLKSDTEKVASLKEIHGEEKEERLKA
jgi:hypothetical protein